MNKHIELVKKWLKDRDSVSLEELEANKAAAYDAYDAYATAAATAYDAAYAAAYDHATHAAYWIERYEELTIKETAKEFTPKELWFVYSDYMYVYSTDSKQEAENYVARYKEVYTSNTYKIVKFVEQEDE